MTKLISRPEYIDQLIQNKDVDLIKIVTGIRRCGKSSLLGKNYIIDMGLRNMLLGYRDADRGHILENIVFLELIRRDYRVYIGKVGEAEVDFVAKSPATSCIFKSQRVCSRHRPVRGSCGRCV